MTTTAIATVMVTATTKATLTLTQSTRMVKTITPMTIVMLGLKRRGHFYIDTSPLLSLPMEPPADLISSL